MNNASDHCSSPADREVRRHQISGQTKFHVLHPRKCFCPVIHLARVWLVANVKAKRTSESPPLPQQQRLPAAVERPLSKALNSRLSERQRPRGREPSVKLTRSAPANLRFSHKREVAKHTRERKPLVPLVWKKKANTRTHNRGACVSIRGAGGWCGVPPEGAASPPTTTTSRQGGITGE